MRWFDAASGTDDSRAVIIHREYLQNHAILMTHVFQAYERKTHERNYSITRRSKTSFYSLKRPPACLSLTSLPTQRHSDQNSTHQISPSGMSNNSFQLLSQQLRLILKGLEFIKY
jgi:hypothetical protein